MGKKWIRRLIVLIMAVLLVAGMAPPALASHGGAATPDQFGALTASEQATWYAVAGSQAPDHWAHQHNKDLVATNNQTFAQQSAKAQSDFVGVHGLGRAAAEWIKQVGGLAKTSPAAPVVSQAVAQEEVAAKGGSCGPAEQRIFRTPASTQVRGLAILELNRDGENDVDGGGDAYALLPRGQVVSLQDVMGSVWEYPSDCSTEEVEGQYNLGLKISAKRVQRSIDALVRAGWVRR